MSEEEYIHTKSRVGHSAHIFERPEDGLRDGYAEDPVESVCGGETRRGLFHPGLPEEDVCGNCRRVMESREEVAE